MIKSLYHKLIIPSLISGWLMFSLSTWMSGKRRLISYQEGRGRSKGCAGDKTWIENYRFAKQQSHFCWYVYVLIYSELIHRVGPKLLSLPGVSYLLSEVFCYFSRQHHRGGSNDNHTAYQVPFNASTLVQQQNVYRDPCTMNVEADDSQLSTVIQPLCKRQRRHT